MKVLVGLISLVLALGLTIGCEKEIVVASGDVVKVNYKGTLDDGTEFDSSEGKEPLQFTVGEGSLIPGFENGVIGMKVGDVKKVTIPAGEAYGEPREDMIANVPKTQFPPDLQYEIGQELMLRTQDGRPLRFKVLEISADSVKVDLNHPLAGKTLTFEITIVEITKPTNQ